MNWICCTLRGDRHYYESHGPRDHIHVACLRCGKVREFESRLYEQLKEQIARDFNMKVTICAHRSGRLLRGVSCPEAFSGRTRRRSEERFASKFQLFPPVRHTARAKPRTRTDCRTDPKAKASPPQEYPVSFGSETGCRDFFSRSFTFNQFRRLAQAPQSRKKLFAVEISRAICSRNSSGPLNFFSSRNRFQKRTSMRFAGISP